MVADAGALDLQRPFRRLQRRPEWLEAARGQYDFCRRFGPDSDLRWNFRVSREGKPLDGAVSLATSHFAIMGLVEYARATQGEEPLDLARRTYERTYALIRSGQPFDSAPYALPPGMKSHGTAMMSALAFYELGEILGDAGVLAAADYFCGQILREFIRPEHRGLVEYVNRDGTFSDTPEGRAVVPGHGIESIWFLLDIYRRSGRRGDIPKVLQTLEWCLERGWDKEFGGLLLGVDLLGKSPLYWKHATFKLWWPVTEALAATLMAYEFDPSPKWLEWHRRIMDWALPRYPVAQHGEWRQRLDREGRPYEKFLILPVKDPFHLPRGILIGIETIERLKGRGISALPLPARRASGCRGGPSPPRPGDLAAARPRTLSRNDSVEPILRREIADTKWWPPTSGRRRAASPAEFPPPGGRRPP